MNSSRETLLREEEEQRKRLRFPIGLESDHESSPSGKPDHRRIPEKEIETTNYPTEDVLDDNASEYISLKELKTKTLYDPEKPIEQSSVYRTDLKAEITNQTEKKVEMAEIPLIDLDSGDNSVRPTNNPAANLPGQS